MPSTTRVQPLTNESTGKLACPVMGQRVDCARTLPARQGTWSAQQRQAHRLMADVQGRWAVSARLAYRNSATHKPPNILSLAACFHKQEPHTVTVQLCLAPVYGYAICLAAARRTQPPLEVSGICGGVNIGGANCAACLAIVYHKQHAQRWRQQDIPPFEDSVAQAGPTLHCSVLQTLPCMTS